MPDTSRPMPPHAEISELRAALKLPLHEVARLVLAANPQTLVTAGPMSLVRQMQAFSNEQVVAALRAEKAIRLPKTAPLALSAPVAAAEPIKPPAAVVASPTTPAADPRSVSPKTINGVPASRIASATTKLKAERREDRIVQIAKSV